MRLIINRCEHCNTEYTFKASGAGCLREENSPHYCPDCMRAILSVLSTIPKKFEKRYNELSIGDNKVIVDEIEEIKKKSFDECGNPKTLAGVISTSSPEIMNLLGSFDDDDPLVEGYIVYDIEYAVRRNKDTGEIMSLHRLEEFDILNQKYTGRVWENIRMVDDCRYLGRYIAFNYPFVKCEDVNPVNLTPPDGLVPFVDYPSLISGKTNEDCTSVDVEIGTNEAKRFLEFKHKFINNQQ